MKFDIISIVFIVIIILYLLIGLKKGFFKSLTSILKNVIAFIMAILLCAPLAHLLVKTNMGENLSYTFQGFFNSKGPLFTTIVTKDNQAILIGQALTSLNMPKLLSSYIGDSMVGILNGIENETLSYALSITFSYYIFVGISFIVLFIVARLLVILLNKLFGLLENITIIKTVDRILGVVLNLIRGLVLVCLLSYIITLIVPTGNGLANYFIKQMALDDKNVFTISKFFYENNFLLIIIAWIQSLFV